MSAALALIGLPSAAQAEDLDTVSSDGEQTPAPLADRIAEITVSPMSALPGGTVHVTGTCTFHGHGATEAFLTLADHARELPGFHIWLSADPVSGDIDADVAMPDDIPPGAFDLFWMCALDDMVFGVSEFLPFTVLTPDSPIPTETPPTEPAESVPTPEPTPAAAPTATERPDALAATGTPDHTIAFAAVGAVAGIGALVLAVAGRTVRHRSR